MAHKSKAKPEAIQKTLGDYVSGLPTTTHAFFDLVSAAPQDRGELADKIHDLEHAADSQYVKLMRKIAGAAVTPFDRGYLHTLIEAIDGVIGSLDRAAYLVIDFDISIYPPEFLAATTELVGMSEKTQDAVDLLKKPNRLLEVLAAINDHEDALDHQYRSLLKTTLVYGADPMAAIRIKTLADAVANVAAALNHFARTISVTAIRDN